MDGKIRARGCSLSRIKVQLDQELLALVRARGTIDVYIKGFYSNNGKAFSESVELPIDLVPKAQGKNG